MKSIAYLLAGLVLGIAASALAHEPSECAPCPPCVGALTPEQAADVEALRQQVQSALQK